MRVIQAYWGKLKNDAVGCMAKVKAIYPQVEVFSFPESKYPSHEADVWRWNMLLNNDDILYMDWDLYPVAQFKFENNRKLSIAFYRGVPEFCCVYSPHKEIFNVFEKSRIKRNIQCTRFAWDRKVFRKHINDVNQIFDEYFIHLRITGLNKLRVQYSQLNK